MSIWGKFSKYITKLGESIDQDLEKSQIDRVEPKKEEINIVIENDTNPSENGNLEEKIAEIEEEILEKNKELIKLQEIIELVGPHGVSLFREFQEREEKTKEIYNKLKKNEDSLLEEISSVAFDPQSLALKDSANNQLEKEIAGLKSKLETLERDEKALRQDDENFADAFLLLDDSIISLNKKKKSIDEEISQYMDQISLIRVRKNSIITEVQKLNKENELQSLELQRIKDSLSSYQERYQKMKYKINTLSIQILEKSTIREKKDEEIRKSKASSMKKYFESEISRIEEERSTVVKMKDQFLSEKYQKNERNRIEKQSIEEEITNQELLSKELEMKINDIKDSLPLLVKPLESRLDNIKTMYQATTQSRLELENRLLKEIKNMKDKIEENNTRIDVIKNEFLNYENEKKEITKRISLIKSSLEDYEIKKSSILSDISNNDESISYQNNQIADLKTKFQSLQSKYREIVEIKNRAEFSKMNAKRDLENNIELLSIQLRKKNIISPFAKWKQLTIQCGDIENSRNKYLAIIEKNNPINRIFGETLKLLSERQERVDNLKKTIKKEKEEFQNKIKMIFG